MKNLFLGIIMIILGYYLINKSDNTISKEEYGLVKNLCANSSETLGMLQDSILESTIAIKRVELTNYILSYEFTVDEKKFKSTKRVTELDEKVMPLERIWYNKENPSINQTEDPCIKLKYYDENKTVGGEKGGFFYFIFGGIIGLAGIQTIFSFLVSLVKTTISKENKNETYDESDFV